MLEAGGIVGIFPEGPFSRNGRLVRGHPGVGLVALRAGVPVVPAAITGTFQALAARRWYVPRRVPLRVQFGRRSASPPRGRRMTQRVRDDVTTRIMAEIAGAPGRRRRFSRYGPCGARGPCGHRGAHRRPAMTDPAPKCPGAGGSASPPTAARAFTASLPFDHRLWPFDLVGSEAWARALGQAGVLARAERDAILRGLAEVREEFEAGTFPYRIELEDIHMNIERRLIEKIGAVGGKLHTGRSRNDQIALDMRLWLRAEIDAIRRALRDVQAALVEQAERHRDRPMPGYTHLQRAQPVLLAHHLLAYVFMLERDRERLADARRRLDVRPLGAGALAGTTAPIDRHALAQALGFRAAAPNSIDAVSDRDFALEFCAAAAIFATHLRGSPRSSCCGLRRSSASSTFPTPTRPGRRSCRRRRTRTWRS